MHIKSLHKGPMAIGDGVCPAAPQICTDIGKLPYLLGDAAQVAGEARHAATAAALPHLSKAL